ncbi:MAG TPA: extensin family protein, partial [Novosphingobium sp.]|nr:extensin family protein [Novosphingobium sp.]
MRKSLALMPMMALLAACGAIPDGPKQQPLRQSTQVFSPAPEMRQCLSELSLTRASFTPLPDQYFGGGCSTIGTVRLASLQGESASLALSNLGPVSCPLAQAFAAWARFGADRAARQMLGSPVARIETMGSYSCRNVAGTERRSAHARAEAIDIAAFVLADGRRISVLNHWNGGSAQERAFLRTVQDSA